MYFFLFLGLIGMFITVLIQSFRNKVRIYKSIIISVLLTIVGTVGAMLMFFVENGYFSGYSFFGALFLVPIAFIAVSLLLKINYSTLMDICAPAGCIIIVIMKINCIRSNCCRGCSMWMTEDGHDVRFPLREVELVVAFILCLILLWLGKKGKFKGLLYPMYMILYGSTRFILNFLREEFYTTKMFIPFGNIWSVVAVLLGVTWFVFNKKSLFKTKKQY